LRQLLRAAHCAVARAALTPHPLRALRALLARAPPRSLMPRLTELEDAGVRAMCATVVPQLRRFSAAELAAWAEPRAACAAYGDDAVRALLDRMGTANATLFSACMAARCAVHGREETSDTLAALSRATAASPRPTRTQRFWRDTRGADPIADIVGAIVDDDNPAPLRDSGLDAARGVDGRGLSSTWLHTAAQEGATACVAYLIAAGADVDAADAIGDTPLHNAARSGQDDALALLLAAGASPGAQNFLNYTPLQVACQTGHLACVRALCEAGSPINTRSLNDAFTPAMTALDSGRAHVLEYLLRALPAVPGGEVVDLTARRLPPNEAFHLLGLALEPSTERDAPRCRQLVVEHAAAAEEAQRGSGDPDDLLALHAPRQARGGGAGRGGMLEHVRRRYVPDSDVPAGRARDVALRVGGAHHLRDVCRVVRYADGATVLRPEATLVPSEFICPAGLANKNDAPRRALAFLAATHTRLGEHSPARILVRAAWLHVHVHVRVHAMHFLRCAGALWLTLSTRFCHFRRSLTRWRASWRWCRARAPPAPRCAAAAAPRAASVTPRTKTQSLPAPASLRVGLASTTARPRAFRPTRWRPPPWLRCAWRRRAPACPACLCARWTT
jgi:hypothetical protein